MSARWYMAEARSGSGKRSEELKHLAVTVVRCGSLIVAKSDSSICSAIAMSCSSFGSRESQL